MKPLHTPTQTTFSLDGPTRDGRPAPVVIEEEEERLPTTAEQELLRYHHRFGHISFHKLQRMVEQRISGWTNAGSQGSDLPSPESTHIMQMVWQKDEYDHCKT
jgi:hypothetical protein